MTALLADLCEEMLSSLERTRYAVAKIEITDFTRRNDADALVDPRPRT